MPFQPGNKLGAKPRLFDAALRRAIAQDDGKRIRAMMERVLELAAEGEQWAVQLLADRLDGKAVQSQEIDIHDSRSEPKHLDDASLAGIIAEDSSSGDASPETSTH